MGNSTEDYERRAKQDFIDALHTNDIITVEQMIRSYPELLHVPIPYADGGGALSFAAQNNRLELVERLVELGAKDRQHALSRACMKAHRAVAEFLVSVGANPNGLYADHATHYGPVILAACEALSPDGLRLLLELGADPNVMYETSDGRIHSPIGFLLGTYMRNPSNKHACLQVLLDAGCRMEETPVASLHLGRLDLLEHHLQKEPDLLHRRFTAQELCLSGQVIAEIGVLSPIEGTTLLHLAVEYDEFAIARWLLNRGADVNARADSPLAHSSGHTPLFHAVLSCAAPSDRRTQFLLDHGADPSIRATLRHPNGGWEALAGRIFTDVTALEYALYFTAAPDWCNRDSIQILEKLK